MESDKGFYSYDLFDVCAEGVRSLDSGLVALYRNGYNRPSANFSFLEVAIHFRKF